MPRAQDLRAHFSPLRPLWIGAMAALLLILPAILGAQDPPPEAPVTVPAARQAQEIVVITIEGPIDRTTAYSVQRRIRDAEKAGAGGLVFELDTPGGEVGAVLEICGFIKNSQISNTVAWINTDAYSGGALVAMACREIVVSESASFGDAAPIQAIPFMGLRGLPETERQKILAPLIAEVVNSARRHGYDENLAQAMLMLGVELWLIEHKSTGERRFVTEREWRIVMEGEPLRGSPRVSSGGAAEKSPTDAPSLDAAPMGGRGSMQGDYAPPTDALDAETIDQVVDALEGAPTRAPLTESDRGQWKFVEYTTDGRTLLVLKSEDMKRYGFATSTVKNDEQLRALFGAVSMKRVNESWSEKLVRVATMTSVRGILIVLFLITMFIEMASPGLGVPGAIAGVCLVGLLAPPLLIGAAGWWTAVAVSLGIVLILLEIFVLPGTALFGLAGIALLIAGLVGTFVSGGSSVGDGVVHGLAIVLLAFFVAGVGMYFIGKFYGSFPVLNRLILSNAPGDRDEAESMLGAMSREAPTGAPVEIGAVGRTLSPLRPAGVAQFGDRVVDVVSEVGFIEERVEIRVVAATPYRVGVEPVDDGESRA